MGWVLDYGLLKPASKEERSVAGRSCEKVACVLLGAASRSRLPRWPFPTIPATWRKIVKHREYGVILPAGSTLHSLVLEYASSSKEFKTGYNLETTLHFEFAQVAKFGFVQEGTNLCDF